MKIYGNVLWEGEFRKGTLEIKEGIVVDFREERNYDIRGTVIPTFINMHTHIGDTYTQEEPKGSLEEIVGPGGLKFKILRNRKKVYLGMRRAMRLMEREGISHFVDFREGGEEGVSLLLEAAKGFKINPVIMCRVRDSRCQGIGMSSLSDHPYDTLKSLSQWAREREKMFAIHASERIREDIDAVLSLNPSFLVHMLEATEEDLRKVASRGIPVVLTPRSNLFFGKIPNVPRFLKFGIKLALGTDNGMISLPSIFREMEIAYKLSRLHGGVDAMDVLRMATITPREILGIRDNYPGGKARLIIFKRLMTPYEIVNKAGSWDIKRIIL